MKQFYKIGEISRLYQIGPDSLRYYEELGLLKPKRGENGYRMYSLHDIWRLNVIRDLRRLDFSMEQIGNYMKDRSVETTRQLMKEELTVIEEQIRLLEGLKADVGERLKTLEQVTEEPIGVVEVKEFPKRNCHILMDPYHSDEEMDLLIKRLVSRDENNLYIIGNNKIGSFLELDGGCTEHYPDYQGVFIIDKNGTSQLEEGTYLSVRYSGSSLQHHIYVPRLLEAAKKMGYTPEGPLLEILWVDIHQAEDIREHITELQVKCYKNGEKGKQHVKYHRDHSV